MAAPKTLTDRQKLFIQEYLVSLNATAAAEAAGYSARNAKAQGCLNLKDPDIKAAIDAAMEKRARRTQVDQDYVIALFVKVAEADDASHMERLRAGELLAKHLGMFTEKVEHSGAVAVNIKINIGSGE